MKARLALAAIVVGLVSSLWVMGQSPTGPADPSRAFPAAPITPQAPPGMPPAGVQSPLVPKDFEDFDKVIADSEKTDGLFKLYRKKERLYLEISLQLASLALDRNELIRALQAQNAVTPAGLARTTEENIFFRVTGGFSSEHDLRSAAKA